MLNVFLSDHLCHKPFGSRTAHRDTSADTEKGTCVLVGWLVGLIGFLGLHLFLDSRVTPLDQSRDEETCDFTGKKEDCYSDL